MLDKKQLNEEDLTKVSGGKEEKPIDTPPIENTTLNSPLPLNGPGGAKKWGSD